MRLIAKFKLAEIAPLAIHSTDPVVFKNQRKGWPSNAPLDKPSVMLVKDQGVYLMSCFASLTAPKEFLPQMGIKGGRFTDLKTGQLKCYYAQGYGPDCEHIGGDDFGDVLEIAEEIVKAWRDGLKTLTLTVTEKEITIKYS